MPTDAVNEDLVYAVPGTANVIELTPRVLSHFERYKQRSMFSCEAGGQLFASFEDHRVMKIVQATGPRRTDKRSLYGFRPDRTAERIEIRDRFAQGLHFVGDWHTHRQRIPEPSSTDTDSICELVRHSRHDLTGFVLIVVGFAEFPAGLHVSFHSATESHPLSPIPRIQHSEPRSTLSN